MPPHGVFFRQNPPFLVFTAEIACLCVLLSFWRRSVIAKLPMILFITLHFSFWIFILWRETQTWLFHIYSRDFVLLLILALPFVHLFQYRRRFERSPNDQMTLRIAAIGITSLILLAAIWGPAKTLAVSHPRDLRTLRIELSRGPCFGACPVYTVTILGDGQVEYIGHQGRSRFETRKQGKIEQQKAIQILQTLDQVNFMALEDRAFSWAFDTPSMGVRVWEDGKTKRVVSDVDVAGPKDGRQSRFVQAAQKIDAILESTQWSHCQGEECVNSNP